MHSILRHVAEKRQMPLEELYQMFGWPLYKKFGHAYDAFKMGLNEPELLFKDLHIEDDLKQDLVVNIKRRMTPQAVKVRADIEVTCFRYEGVDAVKSALMAGESCKRDGVEIKIKLVAPPLYVMFTHCMDKQLGIDTLEKAILKIEETIKGFQGDITIKMKPRAVTETEDMELAALMELAERENAEVSGDDEDEDEDASDSDAD